MSILHLYFLAILSCTYLKHLCLIEAQTRTNAAFTIDLIHRYYSPKSPFYNSSMSSTQLFHKVSLSSASRHREIKWLQNNLGGASTNLIPSQGDFLMQISVGTPPVQLVAAAVTGTDLTWFQCKPCILCYQQNTSSFDPASSRTYQNLPCDAQHCSNLDTTHINCDPKENLCRYWYTYGNATAITEGVMGSDSFFFTNSDGDETVSFSSIAFGCGYQQDGYFDADSAGVVGLGNGPLSLVSQLGPSISYKFSYCLTSVNSYQVSKLRFGGVIEDASGNAVMTTPLVTISPSPFYNLGLNGISIGQMSINMNRDIIIDTGTTLTYLDPSIFYNIEAMVNDVIGANPVTDNPLLEPVLCYDTTTAALIPPDIVFHLNGGDLVLKANNIFFSVGNYLCLSITASPKDGDPMVLGNMAQVNLEIEFDLLSKTVSFSPKECYQESS